MNLFAVRLFLFAAFICVLAQPAPAVTLVENKQPKAAILIEAGVLTPAQQTDLANVQKWLVEALQKASGAQLPVVATDAAAPALILTTAQANPELAAKSRLKTGNPDAFAIHTTGQRVYLIGASPAAIRHASAHLLRTLGFRYYAPSPRWHIVPALPDVRVELNVSEAPDVGSRTIWYAYGMPDKALQENYFRWVFANRLTRNSLISTGHSYGNIIGRNLKEFEAHPEYFALLENGERDTKRAVTARKFCYSNPGLIELVAQDRIKLLAEQRRLNPLEYMVSVDPSDGQGTCECENCKKLGTTTDRVFHLANQVARKLRAVYPDAWVGLYAYSSHRLPPTIDLEPNVYVQVALAFNRTQYTLPELVELWSKKAGAVGLREYYGVEAWDWGLPGRMRGGKADYHRQWIPYYAKRKLTSINAETNANWAGQMLGLHVAAELMWDTDANVDAIVDRYFVDCYGPAAAPMKALQAKFDTGPPLNPGALSAMFEDIDRAYALTNDAGIRVRITDIMAYLVYVDIYRQFELAASREPGRNDVYYQALKPLMTYAWQIRSRDMVHYYALARRLTNGLPIQDKRPEFWLSSKDPLPVWMVGEELTDDQVITRFRDTFTKLKEDKTPYTTYSRYLEAVRPPGPDAGASRLLVGEDKNISSFRGTVTGYLVPTGPQRVVIGLKPANQRVSLKVFSGGEEVLTEQTATDLQAFKRIEIDLPKPGEYRFVLQGEAQIQVPENTPLVYEASASSPAWIDYSGPHYFYVPKGVKKIYVDAEPRLTVIIPGVAGRREIGPTDRVPGQSYSIIEVPDGAAGKVWHTDANTRGRLIFLNIPPLLSLSRNTIMVPREIAELDGLTTAP